MCDTDDAKKKWQCQHGGCPDCLFTNVFMYLGYCQTTLEERLGIYMDSEKLLWFEMKTELKVVGLKKDGSDKVHSVMILL